MPRPLTDTELMALLDSDQDLSVLSADEQQRLLKLSAPKQTGPARDWTDTATEALPAVGATAGGLLGAAGGPLVAAGTAALGGAAGRFGQRAIERARGRETPQGPELVTDAAIEGGKQGGLELAGGAIGRGITGAGRRLYSGLLKPKDAVVESFPKVVEQLIEDARPIAQGARRRVVEGLRRIGQEKNALLSAADARGVTVGRGEMRQGLDDVLNEVIAKSPRPDRDLATLAKIERDFIPYEQTVPGSRAEAIKSTLQNEGERGYRGLAQGKRLTETPMKGRLAVAHRTREAVERQVPEIAPINQQYQRMKGEAKALRDALKREGNTLGFGGAKDVLALAGAGGTYAYTDDPQKAAAVGLLSRLLTTPRTGSMAAIGLDRLGRGTTVTGPSLLRALRALTTEEDEGP